MTPRPVIMDVDTGIDDALALLLALRSPELTVQAITCVTGNHRLEQVVTNTLKVLDIVAAPAIPVAAGMDRALIEAPPEPLALHGQDGMADLGLPPSSRRPVAQHAVELLRATLNAATTPVEVIALAPLTNIACCLRMYPALTAKIRRLTVMGGAFVDPGNTSPIAEFNVRCDPEAAAIVLESGLPICLYPLDPFRAVRFFRHEFEHFAACADPVAQIVGRMMHFSANHFGIDQALIGDAGAVATLLDPAGATMQRLPVTVELAGRIGRGQTVIDRRPLALRTRPGAWWATAPNEIDVVSTVDVERYRARFANAIGAQWPLPA